MAGDRGGKLGDVGDAKGDFELVRGGGGGGTRLPDICCKSSAFLSGNGGFPVAFLISRCDNRCNG